jgi:hypothetical protein
LRGVAEMASELTASIGDAEVYQAMFALDARIADAR